MRGACLLSVLLAGCRFSQAQTFDAFRSWLLDQGTVFGTQLNVGVDGATGLRGLLVDEAVASGTVIFELPAKLVLTVDAARDQGIAWQTCPSSGGSSSSCAATGPGSDLMSPVHTAFALFLLEQRAVGAPWQPWVAAFPEAFDGFPLHYSQDDLAGFQASSLRRVIEMDQDAVARDFAAIVGTRSNMTLEEFQWARIAVKSRVFGLKSLSEGRLASDMIAMAPLADFINHPPDGVVDENVAPSYDPQSGKFSIKAVRNIKRGAGLYWDYGFKSNRHSLTRYGFVSKQRIALTDMPLLFRLNEFPGPAGTAKTLKLAMIEKSKQADLLAVELDGTVMHELTLSLTGPASEKLFGHARFMVFQPRNASTLEEACPATYCRSLGLANEREALRHLSSLLEALLKQHGSSVAEDRELVEGGSVSPADGATWQTLVVRFGEKQVIRGFMRILEAVDALFDLSPWALAAAVKERWNNTGSDIHRYVQENLTTLVENEALRWAKRKVKESRAKTA